MKYKCDDVVFWCNKESDEKIVYKCTVKCLVKELFTNYDDALAYRQSLIYKNFEVIYE
jgi:hypothetical protein